MSGPLCLWECYSVMRGARRLPAEAHRRLGDDAGDADCSQPQAAGPLRLAPQPSLAHHRPG